ncbi:MAG: HEAT repeat domain-containing protein [Planctomycetes bacterium]|nr:HEAT repeat domain-containing protein [Planctomycetota bacterium]
MERRLGLCGDRRALPTLRAHLEAGADDGARGHAAVALGLLGVRDADADLARALREAPHRPELLGDAAVGLALLGRKDVSALLDELIDDRAAASVQSACLTSLGEVGDGRAVDALLELLQDEARPDLTRARAAAALGRLCEPAGQPWTAAFLRHANYLALTDTLLGEHGTGLLGLR